VCPDRKGIVAAVAGFLSDHDASIVEAKQFNDQLTRRFYMRAVFTSVGPKFVSIEQLRAEFAKLANNYDMTWQIEDTARRVRVLIDFLLLHMRSANGRKSAARAVPGSLRLGARAQRKS